MKIRNHQVGILILVFSLIGSSQYFTIISIFLFYMLLLRRRILAQIPRDGLVSLALMIATGLIFVSNNSTYDAAKDLWYIIKVMLVATVGLMVGFRSRPDADFLRVTAIYAAIAVLAALLMFIYAALSDASARFQPELAAVIILVFYQRARLDRALRGSLTKWLLGVCLLFLVIVTSSRVTFVVLITAWIGAGYLFRSRIRVVLAAFSLGVTVFVAVPLLPQYDVQDVTFLGKVQNSITEIRFVDTDDLTTITANWRGFESAKAYEIWQKGTLAQQIFGQGLGKPIDIGIYYNLSEDYSVRELPILHNGYLMVLVKYGVLGSFFFLIFMISPFFLRGHIIDPQFSLAQKIGRVASILLLATAVTITGPLNISELDGIVLLMGWAVGRQRQIMLLNQSRVTVRRSSQQHMPHRERLAPY